MGTFAAERTLEKYTKEEFPDTGYYDCINLDTYWLCNQEGHTPYKLIDVDMIVTEVLGAEERYDSRPPFIFFSSEEPPKNEETGLRTLAYYYWPTGTIVIYNLAAANDAHLVYTSLAHELWHHVLGSGKYAHCTMSDSTAHWEYMKALFRRYGLPKDEFLNYAFYVVLACAGELEVTSNGN